MTDTTQPQNNAKKPRGGDTRAAAARNGKKVGVATKTGTALTEQIKLLVAPDHAALLANFAQQEGVTRQDYIRAVLTEHIGKRLIV